MEFIPYFIVFFSIIGALAFGVWALSMLYTIVCGDLIEWHMKVRELKKRWKDDP